MHVNYHQITFPISVMRAASEKGLDFAGHEFFLWHISVSFVIFPSFFLSRPSSTVTKGVKFILRFPIGCVLNSKRPTLLQCLGK